MESIHPLPKINVDLIAADTLRQQLENARANDCMDENGNPIITLLDFRNENYLNPHKPPPRILSNCRAQTLRLDDLQDPDIRASIPNVGLVVTITETGNRDAYVTRYLSQFGFSNIKGLQFGMRGWIKIGYPTEAEPSSD